MVIKNTSNWLVPFAFGQELHFELLVDTFSVVDFAFEIVLDLFPVCDVDHFDIELSGFGQVL